MFKQFLMKRAKILHGLYRTSVRGHSQGYAADRWWDEEFFTKGLSDRQTISQDKSLLSAAYHYASVEMLILRHLVKENFDLHSKRICDLGSGSGHWIGFYLSLGASACTGVDISSKSVNFLGEKYAKDNRVTICHGKLDQILQNFNDPYDLVNAIGVMFHLVDEEEWQRVISEVSRILKPGGLFVVGGHFGWFNNLNVQFNSDDTVNKKLRSAAHWRRILRSERLGEMKIYRNRAYLFIRDSLPENNLLVATKV